MIGAIIGDIAGSVYEYAGNKDPSVPLFPPGASYTDDSILAVATASAILDQRAYVSAYRQFGHQYPHPMGGYGLGFKQWLMGSDLKPYNSWGNGSAMRVAPVGWAFETLEQTIEEAKRSAEVTHNHMCGITGAQAVAAAIWWARHRKSKNEIRELVVRHFGYALARSVAGIRSTYTFDSSCQGTVPEAIAAFLDSTDFESALRNAISLGGDADTLGCITGGIAQAFYREIPPHLLNPARNLLPAELLGIVDRFSERYPLFHTPS